MPTEQPVVWIDLITGVFTVSALLLLVVELAWLFVRKRLNKPAALEMLASYSTLVPLVLAEIAVGSAWITAFIAAYTYSPMPMPMTWGTAALTLIIVDLVYYWEHRVQHETPLLWALAHTIHHNSPDFTQATAYRLSYADVFISPWFYLPLALVGFDPALILGAYALNLAYQTWIHTEMIGRLKWLDGWLNTPSNHRVHHGTQPHYHNRNFGGILMIWDRLFGSYQREIETPIYGVDEPLNSSNPITILFRDVVALARQVAQAPSWRVGIRTLLRWDAATSKPTAPPTVDA